MSLHKFLSSLQIFSYPQDRLTAGGTAFWLTPNILGWDSLRLLLHSTSVALGP